MSIDKSEIKKQVRVVQLMAILLLFRLPILSVLLMELHDLKVIVKTGRRMLSSFMTTIFSFYLFISAYEILG